MVEEERRDVLEVRLMGEFSMFYRGEAVKLTKKPTSKTLQLLQILLYVGEEGISRERLTEYLFGYDEESDRAVNLRVTAYQLRKILKKMELPDENYIRSEKGRYYFVSSFPVEVDVAVFERLIKEARQCPAEESLKLLKEAGRIGGAFLPALAGEEWVAVEEAHCQHLYFECMEKLCVLMKERGEYEELCALCKKAAVLYPFDEWQVAQIDCLIELDRVEEAMELYEKTTAMYFEELAIPPSERMLEYFQKMRSRLRQNAGSLEEIKNQIREKEEQTGAYFCLLPGFIDSYRITERVMKRSGQSVYLLLCTITQKKSQTSDMRQEDVKEKNHRDVEKIREAGNKLSEAIRESLRQGDVYTRYNRSQFLVMLPEICQEEFPSVIERIDTSFRRKEASPRIQVHYRISSVKT
ncbi:MAG: transcriptional regulator [Lachnospiraceae bacterium]|jgi:DNA-binding SARP family transcriptional activator|nr:transcriptional regulator [Lachnospiraceae bacterium]